MKNLPTGWTKHRLENIAVIQTGIAKNQKIEGDIIEVPYLRVANVQDGHLNLKEIKKIRILKSNVDRYLLKHHDVLLTEGGDFDKLGRGSIWDSQIDICVHQNHIFVVRPDNKRLLPQFLSAQTSSDFGKRYFQSCSKQSTNLASINSSQLKNFPVLLPPLPEQKAIADLLSTWDSAIEKTERLIAAKEKRFQWLLDELIGQAKNHKNVTFGSLLKESRIPDDENDPRKRLSVRLHLKGVEVRDYRGTESEGATAYFKRKAGQFIYGKQNVFKGSVGIVPSELDGYSSTQDIPAFDISERVCAEWLLFLFSYPNFYKKLELYASGSGSKRLHPKELFQMRIPLPPIGRQNEIAKVIGAAQKEIDILKSLAEKYKEQKRGLMQKLLTGEWRVKVA